jgi:hypothetical protein
MRHTFRPRVEALEPRVLPDAAPLSPLVGPFAIGQYPTDPPPAGTHGHGNREFLDDIQEHTDRIVARASTKEDAADAAFVQLQDQPGMADVLRTRLLAVQAAMQNLARTELAAADSAASEARRHERAGNDAAAAIDRTNEQGHAAAQGRAADLAASLGNVIDTPDDAIVAYADLALASYQSEALALRQDTDADAARVRQVRNDPNATRGDQLGAERAYRNISELYRVTVICYARLDLAMGETANQFGH